MKILTEEQQKIKSEKIKIQKHEYYILNKERINKRNREYDKNNPRTEKKSQNKRNWRVLNREREYAVQKQWRDKNPDKVSQYNRTSYERNPESRLRARRKYNQNHRCDPKKAEDTRRWRKNNPEKERMSKYLRRVREYQSIEATLTKEQWSEQLMYFNDYCAYCGEKMTKITIDHFVPLSKGGSHSIDNVFPSCPTCNFSKGPKSIFEFISYISRKDRYAS